MYDCNKCKHLNITEEEQTNKKENHMCLKYGRRVLHNCSSIMSHSSMLYPCIPCCSEDYKNYESVR